MNDSCHPTQNPSEYQELGGDSLPWGKGPWGPVSNLPFHLLVLIPLITLFGDLCAEPTIFFQAFLHAEPFTFLPSLPFWSPHASLQEDILDLFRMYCTLYTTGLDMILLFYM